MIQLGYHITEKDDKLTKIEISDLCKLMTDNTLDLETQIRRLRILLQIDPKEYTRMKVQLPYFTSSVFYPPYRKTENFAYARWFVLDFDYLNQKEINMEDLKNRLHEDDRAALIFTSPGGNGLKVIFELAENCTDPNKYRIFYLEFARRFSEQYGLQQVIDTKTSDVARACFLSYDPDLRYRADAVAIDMNTIVNFESDSEIEKLLKDLPASVQPHFDDTPELPELSEEAFDAIRRKLNPKARIKKEKSYYVPEKVKALEEKILARAEEVGITVTASKNIQYGRQLSVEIDGKPGEINVFHGKKGFSVVKSTKSGCMEEVNEIAVMLVRDVILSYIREESEAGFEEVKELLSEPEENENTGNPDQELTNT